MKKNIIPVIAIVASIILTSLSSFTKNQEFRISPTAAASRYAVYDGTDAQNSPSNYPAYASMPTTPPAPCGGANTLCYFRIDDIDSDNDIDNADFNASFEALDNGSNPGNGTLNDDNEKEDLQLEKKS